MSACFESTTENVTPILPLARYRLTFQVTEPLSMPAYAGSTWRGVFGRALKKLVCVAPQQSQCPTCLLYRSCIYPYIFETPPDPDAGKMRKYNAAPHPFVLFPNDTPAGRLPIGTTVTPELTLFGQSNRYLPYLIHTFDQAGQRGLRGGQLALKAVSQYTSETAHAWPVIYTPSGTLHTIEPQSPTPPPCPPTVTIHLETPLRLRLQNHHVTPDTFRFAHLFSQLLRRISLLMTFHTGKELQTDFAALTRASQPIEVKEPKLRWHDWTRYSSRQDTTMEMGGLLGTFTLDGEGLEPFWPYLWLGQWTHVGKGTSMGLGKYHLE